MAYVDDFLLTYNERWDKSRLTNLFKWGSQDGPVPVVSVIRGSASKTVPALTCRSFGESARW